jgi:hypothetical protein
MYYYVLNGAQNGPVSEDALRQLVSSGQIAPDSLVWREGMAEWQPFATVLGGLATTVVQCSVCKQTFPLDQTIRYGEAYVCGGCKPRFVQAMREGAVNINSQELYNIAVNQRRALLCFAFLIIFNMAQGISGQFSPILAIFFLIGSLATMIFCVVYIYRLAKSLGFTAIIYAIAMLIPCINLLTLLVVISRATKRLKEGGVKVGFLGVRKPDLERLRAS